MPLPVSAQLSLLGVLQFVMDATGESVDRVPDALINAGLTGKITATGCLHSSAQPKLEKYFEHRVLRDRENVPPAAWGTPIADREAVLGDMI